MRGSCARFTLLIDLAGVGGCVACLALPCLALPCLALPCFCFVCPGNGTQRGDSKNKQNSITNKAAKSRRIACNSNNGSSNRRLGWGNNNNIIIKRPMRPDANNNDDDDRLLLGKTTITGRSVDACGKRRGRKRNGWDASSRTPRRGRTERPCYWRTTTTTNTTT